MWGTYQRVSCNAVVVHLESCITWLHHALLQIVLACLLVQSSLLGFPTLNDDFLPLVLWSLGGTKSSLHLRSHALNITNHKDFVCKYILWDYLVRETIHLPCICVSIMQYYNLFCWLKFPALNIGDSEFEACTLWSLCPLLKNLAASCFPFLVAS